MNACRSMRERALNCKGDEDVDAKRSRPSIGKPAKGHASKERVVLIGTDQRITSGPAARTAAFRGRIHGCTRTIRGNVRFSLAPRAPSIHGPSCRFHSVRFPVAGWWQSGHAPAASPGPGRLTDRPQSAILLPLGLGKRMHFHQWNRREFITLLGGTAAAWPLAARAQQQRSPARIGVLLAGLSPTSRASQHFRRGLRDAGYFEGRDVVIEWRSAEGDYNRVPGLASDWSVAGWM